MLMLSCCILDKAIDRAEFFTKEMKLSFIKSIEEFPYNTDRLVLSIPQDELESNQTLEPNPGYGN